MLEDGEDLGELVVFVVGQVDEGIIARQGVLQEGPIVRLLDRI